MTVWTEQLGRQETSIASITSFPGGSGVARASADDNLIDLLRRVSGKSVTSPRSGMLTWFCRRPASGRRDWPSMKQDIRLESTARRAEHERDQALMTSLALLKNGSGRRAGRARGGPSRFGRWHSLATAFEEMDDKDARGESARGGALARAELRKADIRGRCGAHVLDERAKLPAFVQARDRRYAFKVPASGATRSHVQDARK